MDLLGTEPLCEASGTVSSLKVIELSTKMQNNHRKPTNDQKTHKMTTKKHERTKKRKNTK